jgi:hypothetical protein
LSAQLLKADANGADRQIRLHLEHWIQLLTQAAAEEPAGDRRPDPRGKPAKLKSRKRQGDGMAIISRRIAAIRERIARREAATASCAGHYSIPLPTSMAFLLMFPEAWLVKRE